MKKRINFSMMLVVFTSVLVLAFWSCSTEVAPTGNNSEEFNNSTEYELITVDILATEIKDASIDRDIEYPSDLAVRQNHRRCDINLSILIRHLNLDENQKAALHEAIREHHHCVQLIRERAYNEMKEIIHNAREARHDILAKLRSGEITPEEARDAIHTLNQRVRESIASLRVHICQALKDCMHELLRKIASILTTDEQRAIFQRWLESLPDCPCERVNTDTE